MTIPQQIIDEIISQAQREAPCEACGYLLGISTEDEGNVVAENYPMENADHSLCHPLPPRRHTPQRLPHTGRQSHGERRDIPHVSVHIGLRRFFFLPMMLKYTIKDDKKRSYHFVRKNAVSLTK